MRDDSGDKAAQPIASKAGRTQRRSRGLRALGETLAAVTRPALGRRGLAAGGLLHDWQAIVGPEIAAVSLPLRLSFPHRDRRAEGTLNLRVAPGYGVLLQHVEPQIRERVNGYLGYNAVARLRLQQGPLSGPRRPPPSAPRSLPPAAEARLK
ncbi:MAG: DUF721 domain-containing protein, partial [Kiloniellales bacterium]